MIDISAEERRSAFSIWLQTGRRPTMRPDGVELKFNPYHDPHNGQFTFAPGGPRSLDRVKVSDRRAKAKFAQPAARDLGASAGSISQEESPVLPTVPIAESPHLPNAMNSTLQPVQMMRAPRGPRTTGRGSNSGDVPYDPVVLARVAPGLLRAPAGAVIAVVDNLLDITGPQLEATGVLTRNWSNFLIGQIKAIDPKYEFRSLGFPQSLEGQINQLNNLRMDRAVAYVRMKGELRPMQVEVLRLMQRTADRAYDEGLALQRAGRLKSRLSDAEALGNYVDLRVRTRLRRVLNGYGIGETRGGPISVNRDEKLAPEGTRRRPDARIGKVAFDVSLTAKTLRTPQIRDFFSTDFAPNYTIIIRPRQLDNGGSYIITRPGAKR